MKIYTRTGDEGTTGLFGGGRVSKDNARIEAYGTVDELNATIGMVRSVGVSARLDEQLCQIQHELFSLGAELATPDAASHDLRVIDGRHIGRLEQWIDEHESDLPPLKQFILPAGTTAATTLHLARSVCRRAERRVVTLGEGAGAELSENLVIYLNRLSDLLFVLSRVANANADVPDVGWFRPS
jgi:cob(I)alamin adenosyltransferase